LLAATGTRPSALQYTGEQNDLDTGLIYLRARWYDPATGRFTTRDPFPGFAVLPQTLHPYVYVNNNPVNLTDPSGEIADIFWDLAIFGVDLLLFFFDSINPTLDECTREQLLSLDRIALGLDLAAIAVPFIPGGSGLAGRLAGRGILILAQGGARASVRAIRVSVQAGVQAGVHASAMTKGSGRGTRGVIGGGGGNSGGSRRGDLKTYEDGYLKGKGIDAHKFKESIVGKSNISKYNIAVGKDESVWLVSRQHGGEVISTEYMFDDLANDFPLRK
jgi:RHS repeat-associated protein